jgi:hypothetical protein
VTGISSSVPIDSTIDSDRHEIEYAIGTTSPFDGPSHPARRSTDTINSAWTFTAHERWSVSLTMVGLGLRLG